MGSKIIFSSKVLFISIHRASVALQVHFILWKDTGGVGLNIRGCCYPYKITLSVDNQFLRDQLDKSAIQGLLMLWLVGEREGFPCNPMVCQSNFCSQILCHKFILWALPEKEAKQASIAYCSIREHIAFKPH